MIARLHGLRVFECPVSTIGFVPERIALDFARRIPAKAEFRGLRSSLDRILNPVTMSPRSVGRPSSLFLAETCLEQLRGYPVEDALFHIRNVICPFGGIFHRKRQIATGLLGNPLVVTFKAANSSSSAAVPNPIVMLQQVRPSGHWSRLSPPRWRG